MMLSSPMVAGDHPRICGEHDASEPVSAGGAGSSPHMRGAQEFSAISNEVSGIIPAYAGSTFCVVPSNTRRKDHPRICGEHVEFAYKVTISGGSSPHMRGALAARTHLDDGLGIIPAYAGSTTVLSGIMKRSTDHPRICGEHERPDRA